MRPVQPGKKIRPEIHKFYYKAGIPTKLGFTETVPESWTTQKAGMVAKIFPKSWFDQNGP